MENNSTGNPTETRMEQYAAIQPFVQKEIKSMFETQYKQYATKYGVASVPLHVHNGSDAPQIRQQDVIASPAASGLITMATNGRRYEIGLNTKPGVAFSPSLIRFSGIAVYEHTTFTVTAANATIGAVYQTGGLTFTVLTTIAGTTTLSTEGAGVGLNIPSGTLTKVSGTGDSTITWSAAAVSNTIRSHVVGDAFISQPGNSFYLQPGTSSEVVVGGPAQVVVQSCSMLLINNTGSGSATLATATEGHIVNVVFPAGTIVARATIPDRGDYGAADNPIQNGVLLIDVQLASGWAIVGNFVII